MARKISDMIFESVVAILARVHREFGHEPFDGDVTEELSKVILAEIDYQEGNINSQEYYEKTDKHWRKVGHLLSGQ